MHEMLAESLGNQVIAQSAGPLVTVLLGGFVLGFITRQFQIRDADQKLRESMALDVARIGGLFYSLVAAAMRAKATEDLAIINAAKKALEDNFERFIVDGGVLEKRLSAYSVNVTLTGMPQAIVQLSSITKCQRRPRGFKIELLPSIRKVLMKKNIADFLKRSFMIHIK